MATFSAAAFKNAAPGLGALAQAIGGGPGGAYESARAGEINLQSKLAQALAATQASEATARLNSAKATGAEEQNALGRPEALRRNAMSSYGIPLEEEGAVNNYFQTGELGGKYAAPIDGVGPVAPAPDWSKNLGDVGRAISGVQTALTIGDKSSENIAKAGAINRESRLSDAIIAGTANRNAVGGAQAAVAGKDLYNRDATGSVLDQFTGALDTSNPLATSTINLRKEQAGAQKANAAQSYASAGNSNASAAKTRQDMGRGVLVQTADGPVFANPRDGTGIPVMINGAPAKPAKGKGAVAMSSVLQKELIEADDIANTATQTAATLRKALDLNKKAYEGYGALMRARVTSNFKDSDSANATIDLNNMIGEQALSGMKVIFGGNPTEGERAILLDLQASADKTPAQRKSIIDRGIAAAERRAGLSKERAKAIRSGSYLSEEADPAEATIPKSIVVDY